MKLEFHPEAEEEFLETVSYYESQLPGLGEQFRAELERAGSLLLRYPDFGPLIDPPRRKLVLNRFPYYLIYAAAGATIHTSLPWPTKGASRVTGRNESDARRC